MNNQVENFLNSLLSANLIGREDFGKLSTYPSPEDVFEALEVTVSSNIKLSEVYAKFRDLPFVQINTIDQKAIDLIDRDLARKIGFIPFFIDERHKILQVAITNPRKLLVLNKEKLDELGNKLGYRIEVMMASRDQVEKALYAKKFKTVEKLDEMEIRQEILKKIPYDLAIKFQAVPFGQDEQGTIKIAAADPESDQIQEIKDYLAANSIATELYFADPREIKNVLNRMAPKETQIENINPETAMQPTVYEDNAEIIIDESNASVEAIKNFSSSNLPEELIKALIALAVMKKASDIHIEPFERMVKVRFRVDGQMEEVASLPYSQLAPIVSKIKVISRLKLEEDRIPQDGKFDVSFKNYKIDLRVSTLPTIFGEKTVLRILPKTKSLVDLKSLGLGDSIYEKLEKCISLPYGVTIVTGPNGSGKTTTVYSIINKLNKPEADIITLEDTVEYEIENINQVKIQPSLGFGYAEGIRSALKQDPNIIFVGEVLDKEVAELVSHAALTGRKILTTMHTNDASEALPRLINLGVEPFLLASSVKCVVAERLVRRLCEKCKEEADLSPTLKAEIQKELAGLNINIPLVFYRAKGCSECKNGFSGRIGIFEVLVIDSKIEELVIGKKNAEEILSAAKASGFITIKQDGFIKVLKGLTTVDEVIRATIMMDE